MATICPRKGSDRAALVGQVEWPLVATTVRLRFNLRLSCISVPLGKERRARMMENLKSELYRLKQTVIWSIAGWRAAWKTEKSLRQWTLANALSVALAMVLDLTAAERALIVGFGLLILAAELLNTGIEETVNRISQVDHPLSKKAKDIGSAAVAVTAIAAGCVWLIVLIG